MCTYLAKRGSTYCFRRAVPVHLRPFLDGRAEWMISLRTKDRDAAKKIIPSHTIETDRLLEAAEAAHRASSGIPATNEPEPSPRASLAINRLRASEFKAARYADAERAAKEARRDDVADLIEFITERLNGSTADMPREFRAIAYLLRDKEYDMALLRDQLAISRAALAEKDGAIVIEHRPSTVPRPTGSESGVPLLATFDAYTGARVNEISQLRGSDVTQINGASARF